MFTNIKLTFMKKIKLFVLSILCFGAMSSFAQRSELQPDQLPKEVKDVLIEYLKILNTSTSLDDCAINVVKVCAGHLLTSDLKSIAGDVKPYSLKKDFENAKFYKSPPEITRVQLYKGDYDGYQNTLIEGDSYKIWIAKKDGVAGMPAPIKILVPKSGQKFTTPKVISVIGSL